MRFRTFSNLKQISIERQRNTLAAVALWASVLLITPFSRASPSFQASPQAGFTAQAAPGASPALSPKEARAARIDADTEKLVQLAEELKTELAKSGKDTLSVQVIKKTNEIEKLAKSLKERLRRESAM